MKQGIESAEGAGVDQVLIGVLDELSHQFGVAMDVATLGVNNRKERSEKSRSKTQKDGSVIRQVKIVIVKKSHLDKIWNEVRRE
jgi:hypothetical protein